MASASDIVKRIKDEEIEWVDLRFTDPRGKWQHLSMVSSVLDEDALEEGLMFDGSSIGGWKTINESDMILKPDLNAVYVDPFSATPMMIVFCDIVETDSDGPRQCTGCVDEAADGGERPGTDPVRHLPCPDREERHHQRSRSEGKPCLQRRPTPTRLRPDNDREQHRGEARAEDEHRERRDRERADA